MENNSNISMINESIVEAKMGVNPPNSKKMIVYSSRPPLASRASNTKCSSSQAKPLKGLDFRRFESFNPTSLNDISKLKNEDKENI